MKNTNAVSRTTGKARTPNAPALAKCENITRTAHPATDPTPLAVRSSTTATNIASFVSCPVPNTISPTPTATATLMAVAIARARLLRSRDTSQPTIVIVGMVSVTIASRTTSLVLGSSVIVTSWPPVIK